MIHPWQSGEFGIGAGQEICEGATRQIGRAQTVADVAARARDPGHRVIARARVPVAGDPKRSAPAVRDGDVSDRREQLAQCRLEVREHAGRAVVLGSDGARPVIARAAATERETVVCGALPIDQKVTEVAEGLPVRQPDLVPERLGKRLRRDHQRIQRQDAAVRLRHSRTVSLGRHDDPIGRDGPPRGGHRSRSPLEHLGLLGDHGSTSFHRAREPAHQLGRVHARARRIERGAECSRGPHPVGSPGLERIDAELRRFRNLRASCRPLHGRAGVGNRAALDIVGVDPGFGCGAPHLVDRGDHRSPHGDGGVPPVRARERGR